MARQVIPLLLLEAKYGFVLAKRQEIRAVTSPGGGTGLVSGVCAGQCSSVSAVCAALGSPDRLTENTTRGVYSALMARWRGG
ncbi:hypothetical protein AOLI_G00145970 [Acnodon oligacanthus]